MLLAFYVKVCVCVTWYIGDLSEQSEEQLQSRRLVLARTVGHSCCELLQQQNPHLDQTCRTHRAEAVLDWRREVIMKREIKEK